MMPMAMVVIVMPMVPMTMVVAMTVTHRLQSAAARLIGELLRHGRERGGKSGRGASAD